jgi:hypothetical protein
MMEKAKASAKPIMTLRIKPPPNSSMLRLQWSRAAADNLA